jgi:succinate-semialdehyde dehydrogenase/glutarate-semialdehyde dehydrogenase
MTHSQSYIGGRWCDAESGATYDAINPATGQPFGTVARCTRADAKRAVAAANAAQLSWRHTSLWERTAVCNRVADVLDRRKDEIADTLTTELGKPRYGEAAMEAGEASVPWRIAAETAKYFEGHTKPAQDAKKRVLTFWRARGVITVLTPWNFPAAIPGEYLPFAIAMGNTVCWSPAPTAAATAAKLMECVHEAGVPAGVINLVTGPGAEVGDELVVNPGTHAVGMTGSPATARQIAARAGLKPRIFELGGNGPIIVLDDADVEQIAPSIAFACYFAAGQVCSCAERIFVADPLHDRLADALVRESKKFVLGDPLDEKVTMGPQNNMGVVQKIGRHIEDAVSKGASILTGGKRPDRPGYFFEPTVMTGLPIDSIANHEETFGPVAKLRSFRSDDDVWRYINACNLGLVSAVFTRDVDRAWNWAEALNTGITVVNDFTHFWEHHLPFGGMASNDSGTGRIGGRHMLEFMSDLKTIAFNIGAPSV